MKFGLGIGASERAEESRGREAREVEVVRLISTRVRDVELVGGRIWFGSGSS